MTIHNNFDVIIIGGSYSGLSAGLVLGRALRHVLIIDSGKPCNIQTPHSHNFITQDGKTPKEISTVAKLQVENYKSVKFYNGLATSGTKIDIGFEVKTKAGDRFQFERQGYFCADQDSSDDKPVFNLTVPLRDSWAKIQKKSK